MRVEREVQVLSELGHRWSTPVFKHMQIGLALILATHKKRKHTHLYIYICKYHCHIFVRKNRPIMLPSWLLTGFWLCWSSGGSRISPPTCRRNEFSPLWGSLTGRNERRRQQAQTVVWCGVRRGCLEPFVRAHRRLAVWHLSELHREITGHSKDRWQVQSVSFTRADTHQHALFLTSCCLMCAKVKLFPKFRRVCVVCMTFVHI